jgi:two-component system KDP operon response regulator KdpE
MSAGRILVVDDDPQIRRVMRVALTSHGYEVDDATNGEEALDRLRDRTADLVLLDMNMPGMGGLETCRAIRVGSEVSIIMLTVRDSEADKIAALDAGADDYVTKPFNMGELLARIRAALRRTPSVQSAATSRVRLGDTEIDFDARQVNAPGRQVRLAPKELEVLRYLATHANKTVNHREVLQAVWGPDYGDEVDSLRVVINQLRKKIEADPARPVFILTEPWVGYRLVTTPSSNASNSSA